MDCGIYHMDEISNSKISDMVKKRGDFVIEGITVMNYKETLKTVEKIIEDQGMKCRVYTKGRAAGMIGAVIPGPTLLVGWATGIGIGVHNLATFNPDYEIAKNPATGTLSVNYKH